MKKINFVTTGLPKPVPAASSAIGPLHGERGAETKSSSAKSENPVRPWVDAKASGSLAGIVSRAMQGAAQVTAWAREWETLADPLSTPTDIVSRMAERLAGPIDADSVGIAMSRYGVHVWRSSLDGGDVSTGHMEFVDALSRYPAALVLWALAEHPHRGPGNEGHFAPTVSRLVQVMAPELPAWEPVYAVARWHTPEQARRRAEKIETRIRVLALYGRGYTPGQAKHEVPDRKRSEALGRESFAAWARGEAARLGACLATMKENA